VKRNKEAERTNGQGRSASKTVTLGHAKSDSKTELRSESSKDEAAVGTDELPDWIAETPEHIESSYELAMYNDGAGVQDIDLTRDEFEFLKTQLAIHRGYIPAERQESSDNSTSAAPGRQFSSDGERLSAKSLIADVQDQCQEFLKYASYLDLRLMYEVLQYHSSNTIPCQQDEAGLADAFMTELGLEAPVSEGTPAAE